MGLNHHLVLTRLKAHHPTYLNKNGRDKWLHPLYVRVGEIREYIKRTNHLERAASPQQDISFNSLL